MEYREYRRTEDFQVVSSEYSVLIAACLASRHADELKYSIKLTI